jgi:hypothetical protein
VMFAATSAATNGDRVGDEVGGQEASLCKATDVLQVDGVEFRNVVLDKTVRNGQRREALRANNTEHTPGRC